MKRNIAIILVSILTAGVLSACGGGASAPAPASAPSPASPSAPAASGGVVKIGVFEPQSGDNGAGGKQEILGMQYANSVTPTVDIGGTTYNVQLVYADNQSSTDKAPSAAQSLVSAGCSVVLGSYGSAVSIAAASVFGDAGVPVIGVTCTNPAVTTGNDFYFRICFLDPFQGTVLANFAKDKFQAKKAYCLAKQGDDYSVGLCNYFMQAFGKDNCKYETFPEGTSDYSSYVANAKAYGASVFFSPVSTEAAALIIDQANTQNMSIPILAGDTWDSNVILNAAKGKNVQIFVTTFYQEGGNPQFDSGIKQWISGSDTNKTNNGGDDKVAAVSAMGNDAYYVALEAMKKAGSVKPADILAALPGVKYTGVTGDISFNSIGDANRNVAYVKQCNTQTGVWDFVTQQTVSAS